MRELQASIVANSVSHLFIEANRRLSDEILSALKSCVKIETSPMGNEILSQLVENASFAENTGIPLCQDTGSALVFLEIGQDIHIVDGNLQDAIDEGVRRGCLDGNLRASIVSPPLGARSNTKDNTPAVIHMSVVPGDSLRITVVAQGGDSENVSALKMLRPADGFEGIRQFVVSTVAAAGAEPCPPIIVGVGIGGNFELCALLAKKALLRPLGAAHPDAAIACREDGLLEEINALGIGPGGLGGTITALAVHIETAPCHIASLPVAVALSCHSLRHREIVL